MLMRAASSLFLLSLAALASATMVPMRRQGVNEVYPGNEAQMTGVFNVTYHLLPIPKATAQKIAGGRALLRPTGFPAGYLKDDEHVLVVADGYMSDIRMLDLRVDRLKSTIVIVPFVDQLKDGKTPFRLTATSYQDQVVPALVGSLTQGFVLVPSVFDPKDTPYNPVGPNKFSSSVFTGVDNQIPVLGGPGLLHPLFQTTFERVKGGKVPVSTYKSIVDQPTLHPVFGTCSKEHNFFKNDQANPFHVKGSNIQTYPPTTPTDQTYKGTEGYSLSIQWIASAGPGSACSTFAS